MIRMQKIKPMLAELGTEKDLQRKDIIVEPKFDGTRALVYKNNNEIKILNRRGNWIEYRYPEFTNQNSGLVKFIKAKSCILDGEIVVLNEKNIPDFNLLQTREQVERRFEIELNAREIPATYIVFDIIELNGRKLTNKPLIERKKILNRIVKENSIIAKCIYTKNGQKLFKEIKKYGMEGVMIKKEDSLYVLGKRSDLWLKVKFLKTIDCLIVGYREGEGKRFGAFGALCLGIYHNKKLTYIGRVGTGWSDKFVKEFYPHLKKIEQRSPLVVNPPKNWQDLKIHWTKPKFVCEIEYLEITKGLELRAPSFKRLRLDKNPEECEI